MIFSPRVVVGLLNSFKMFHITTKYLVINSYNCFLSFGSFCHPIPHFQKKATNSFARFVLVLGGYQLLNIPTRIGIGSFKNSCYQPNLDIRVKKGWLLASMWQI
jgi:hypothetical protein